jgi:hypothetical protein
MHTELVKIARHEAVALYQKYKTHAAYSQPIDWEIQRTYHLLSKGKVIIKALESIKQAGLDREFLPKLALAPATAEKCHLTRISTGRCIMSPRAFLRGRKDEIDLRENTFVFPRESFPMNTWGNPARRSERSEHEAQVPIIPVHLRPKRGLQNYHVLWEAEWHRVPPRDPYLLRRIGKADLWLVVAHWDLTEVERAALATRV